MVDTHGVRLGLPIPLDAADDIAHALQVLKILLDPELLRCLALRRGQELQAAGLAQGGARRGRPERPALRRGLRRGLPALRAQGEERLGHAPALRAQPEPDVPAESVGDALEARAGAERAEAGRGVAGGGVDLYKARQDLIEALAPRLVMGYLAEPPPLPLRWGGVAPPQLRPPFAARGRWGEARQLGRVRGTQGVGLQPPVGAEPAAAD
mmetsp:Transcript_55613/g.162588  ORF Transcript_55613/g.162588 Transcript_55613/m.162588 type:complete len:210 (+) Transcript_55613:271-900(+)